MAYERAENEAQLKAIAAKLKPGTVSELIFAGHGDSGALDLGPNLVLRKGYFQLPGASLAKAHVREAAS